MHDLGLGLVELVTPHVADEKHYLCDSTALVARSPAAPLAPPPWVCKVATVRPQHSSRRRAVEHTRRRRQRAQVDR